MLFYGILAVGFLLTSALYAVSCRNKVPVWKCVLTGALALGAGYLGARILYSVEHGHWGHGGISFYGSVFLVPAVVALAAWLMRVKPGVLLDPSAAAISFISVMVKINCLREGCCRGMVLRVDELGEPLTRFPSQIVESCAALVLGVFFLLLLRQKRFNNRLYPMFMVIYGVVRFLLNLLRDTEPFVLGLAAGNFWSLISIGIGAAWLVCSNRRRTPLR